MRIGRRHDLGCVVLLILLPAVFGDGHDLGPRGTVSAFATQTKTYSDQVRLSYFEPVNCTLEFDVAVDSFEPTMFTTDDTTLISNFEEVSKSRYTFQLSASTNANVTILIAPQTVQAAGYFNNETTAFFSFEFFAFPPSVTLRLDGYVAQSTRSLTNIAYLFFNSTTQYDDSSQWFNNTHISFIPALQIEDFRQVDEKMYRFRFRIEQNQSSPAVNCMEPGAKLPSDEHIAFDCSLCNRPQRCVSQTRYPPGNVDYLEFPLRLALQAVPELGLPEQNLTLVYDTLWAYVDMDAPMYAQAPFYITVTWSEPLNDLVAIQPVFDLSGPPVTETNLTVLGPKSFRLLVAPMRTGVLKIKINGTEESVDLAGNTNDFRRNPPSRTGAERIVIFSMGPPLLGQMEFAYSRPRLRDEYPPVFGFSNLASMEKPSLTVSWSGFVTATRYNAWIRWGQNMSTTVVSDLNVTEHVFNDFSALLGVEYMVYVQGFDYWGQSTNSTRIFLLPNTDIIADGSRSIASLPDIMSPLDTKVSFNAIIPEGSFLSMNPLKVLSFRTINRTAGDQDPCMANTKVSTCTFVNFHMEVPASRFVIFRSPIRLQFIFGRQGWQDLYYRPRLSYWEEHHEEWRNVLSTCPPEQVFDRWNDLHRIYEVSVCHLSQFALFQDFEPPPPPAATPAPARPSSYNSPTFFAALGGSVIGTIILCCICYVLCLRSRSADRPLVYSNMGIKSVAERLPRRGLGNSRKLSIKDAPRQAPEEMQPALAAEPAWAAEPELGAEVERPPRTLPVREPLALPAPVEDTTEPQILTLPAVQPGSAPLSGPPSSPPRELPYDKAGQHAAPPPGRPPGSPPGRPPGSPPRGPPLEQSIQQEGPLSGSSSGPPRGPPPLGVPPIAPMSVLPGAPPSAPPAAPAGFPLAEAVGASLDLSPPGLLDGPLDIFSQPNSLPAEARIEPPGADTRREPSAAEAEQDPHQVDSLRAMKAAMGMG